VRRVAGNFVASILCCCHNGDHDGSVKRMLELQRWLYGEASTQLKALGSGLEPLTLLSAVCIATRCMSTALNAAALVAIG
jgi:hypothetical protein